MENNNLLEPIIDLMWTPEEDVEEISISPHAWMDPSCGNHTSRPTAVTSYWC